MLMTRSQLMSIIRESLKDVTPDQKKSTAIEAGYLTLQPSIASLLGIPAITTGPVIPQDVMRKEEEVVDHYHDPDIPPERVDKEEESLEDVNIHDVETDEYVKKYKVDSLDIDSRGM